MIVDESMLKFYSIGIVVKDKDWESSRIEVCPIEHVADVEGKLDKSETVSGKMKNRYGEVESVTLVKKNSVEAKWICLGGSNRSTAPDVRKNETVLLLTYGDTQEYYWTTMLNEPLLRRLEHVVYLFSNRSDQPTESTADLDSSYNLTVSTRDKLIHLKTCSNDGEYTQWDVILDTKEGQLTVDDNTGNNIVLHSPSSTLTVTTNEKVIVNTTDVTVNASNSTTVNTVHATVNAESDATLNTQHAMVNAGTDATVNTPLATVNASNAVAVTAGSAVSIAAPSISITGEVSVTGNVSVSGALSAVAGLVMPGAISVSGGGISVSVPISSNSPIVSTSYIQGNI